MREWAGTTYGNGWMHRELIRMLRYIDVRILYAFVAIFVIPVCLIVNPAQKVIYRYYRERWGMSFLMACCRTYRNFYLFSQVVVDRFAMYAGKNFHFETEGYEEFQRLASREEGFLQFSAHIGNYELAGYTLKADRKRFNALVFAGEKESVMMNRTRMFDSRNIRMIPIRQDMSHLFTINEALANGETVSMPADRMIGSNKTVTQSFLGRDAAFPLGPFSVATMRGLDVLAVNVMKTGTKSYRIHVTPLGYDKSASRKIQTEQLANAYVRELERIVSRYPDQWYNYYEFWNV